MDREWWWRSPHFSLPRGMRWGMVQRKSLDGRPFRHRKEDLSPRELGVRGGQSLGAVAGLTAITDSCTTIWKQQGIQGPAQKSLMNLSPHKIESRTKSYQTRFWQALSKWQCTLLFLKALSMEGYPELRLCDMEKWMFFICQANCSSRNKSGM